MDEKKSNSIQEDLKESGYSSEEEYFHRLNRELIEKRKRGKTTETKPHYWMKCPKCGSRMQEIELSEVHAEQCAYCRGVYFDQLELKLFIETLAESKAPRNVLKRLFKNIKDKMLHADTTWKP